MSGIFRQREECRWCESYLMSSETFAIGTQRTHYVHAWQKWLRGTGSLCEMPNTQKKMHRHRLFGGILSGWRIGEVNCSALFCQEDVSSAQ